MRQPKHQAEFFKLLAKILYYMVSGNSDIGYLAKDEWNPYFKVQTGLQVCTPSSPLSLCFPAFYFLAPYSRFFCSCPVFSAL
jgi:hypothetical protein